MIPTCPGNCTAAPIGRRVRRSTRLSVPSVSRKASVRSSGLTSRSITRSPSPRSTPIAAGVRSSAASRLSRVCGVSSSVDALRARAAARGRGRPRRARARRAAAASAAVASRACAGALVERDRAGDDSASASSTPRPADDRSQPSLRALARRAARGEEVALDRVELAVVRGRPLQRGGQPRAAVQLAGVAPRVVPVARGLRAGARAAGVPAASSSSQPRSRGHSRSSASCATSTSSSPSVTRRSSASTASTSATSVAVRARRAGRAGGRPRRPSPVARPAAGGSARASARSLRLEPLVRALGQPRDRALHAAGALVGRRSRSALPVAVLPQLEQRRGQQRQRARLALDVGDAARR